MNTIAGSTVLFVTALLINTLTAAGCLVYALWHCKDEDKKQKEHWCIVALGIFICPVVALTALTTGYLLSRILYRNMGNLAEITFSKERTAADIAGDFNTEANLVPVREALSISGNTERRKLMLDILRGGTMDALPQLKEALSSTDSETSHYAAAAIVDALAEFRDAAARYSAALVEDATDRKSATTLIDLLLRFLPQGVLFEDETDVYAEMLLDVAENLFALDPTALSAAEYRGVVDICTDSQRTEQGEIWSERVMNCWPFELDSYCACLRYYYETKQRERFLHTIGQLKRSGVIVDKRTMELIRIYR